MVHHPAVESGSTAGLLVAGSDSFDAPPDQARLFGIGAAAERAGVSERALRYYQQIGLITPSGRTPGGMRRYSEADLTRVARIRELQTLLGFNLDEIAVVLRNDDRTSQLCLRAHDEQNHGTKRQALLTECLCLQEDLRERVATKRVALSGFMADLDARIGRIRDLLNGS
jgi:DNA-binding transcriptional MerR regulator